MYLEDIITIKGKEVDSSKTFNDNRYLCQYDQIYLYKRMVKWLPVRDQMFYYTNKK